MPIGGFLRNLMAVLLLALPLHADTLTDLRAALARFTGRDTIRATVDIQQTVDNSGRFGNEKYSGQATIDIEGDANGLKVVLSRPLLEQMSRELRARARDSNQTAPTISAVNEIGSVAAAEAIDYAPSLVNLMDGAKVVEERAGQWQGKPARIVVLRLADNLGDDKGKVTYTENRLTLWLANDHVPMAGEHSVGAKFSILFLKGEMKKKSSFTLAPVGDRLVRLRAQASQSTAGLGQKGNESTVATVRVHG
jgi:hypothetical protein